MRELLILLLIGAVGYLAFDDYYKQRPALEQAQQQIQQLSATSGQARRSWAPVNRTPPAWFQKHLDEAPLTEAPLRHHRQDEIPSTPRP